MREIKKFINIYTCMYADKNVFLFLSNKKFEDKCKHGEGHFQSIIIIIWVVNII